MLQPIDQVHDFQALLAEALQERRRRDSCDVAACDVVGVVLALFHAIIILLEADLLVSRFGGVEAQQLCNLVPVS